MIITHLHVRLRNIMDFSSSSHPPLLPPLLLLLPLFLLIFLLVNPKLSSFPILEFHNFPEFSLQINSLPYMFTATL
jgi:hypothetical protein